MCSWVGVLQLVVGPVCMTGGTARHSALPEDVPGSLNYCGSWDLVKLLLSRSSFNYWLLQPVVRAQFVVARLWFARCRGLSWTVLMFFASDSKIEYRVHGRTTASRVFNGKGHGPVGNLTYLRRRFLRSLLTRSSGLLCPSESLS